MIHGDLTGQALHVAHNRGAARKGHELGNAHRRVPHKPDGLQNKGVLSVGALGTDLFEGRRVDRLKGG